MKGTINILNFFTFTYLSRVEGIDTGGIPRGLSSQLAAREIGHGSSNIFVDQGGQTRVVKVVLCAMERPVFE